MLEFPSIDANVIQKRLKVEDTSIQQGQKNQPPREATGLDPFEAGIVNEFEKLIVAARSIAANEVTRVHGELNRLFAEFRGGSFFSECNAIPGAIREEITAHITDKQDVLKASRHAERTFVRNRNYFRMKHELNREAVYPESAWLHWGILIGLVVVESLANAYFFAEASSLGLLGGWFTAIIISLLIVLASAKLVGTRIVPYVHHIEIVSRVLAVIGIVFYAVALVAIAFLISHYRYLLLSDPDNALRLALPHMLGNTFELDPLSWVFFVASVVFGILGTITGYKADDPYAQYGDIDRRYQSSLSDYNLQRAEFLEGVSAILATAEKKLDAKVIDRANRVFSDYIATIPLLDQIKQRYSLFLEAATRSCNTVLKTYRTRNMQVRGGGSEPRHFNESYAYGEIGVLQVPDTVQYHKFGQEMEAELKRILIRAAEVKDEIRALADRERERVMQFISQLEETAAAAAVEDAQFGVAALPVPR